MARIHFWQILIKHFTPHGPGSRLASNGFKLISNCHFIRPHEPLMAITVASTSGMAIPQIQIVGYHFLFWWMSGYHPIGTPAGRMCEYSPPVARWVNQLPVWTRSHPCIDGKEVSRGWDRRRSKSLCNLPYNHGDSQTRCHEA